MAVIGVIWSSQECYRLWAQVLQHYLSMALLVPKCRLVLGSESLHSSNIQSLIAIKSRDSIAIMFYQLSAPKTHRMVECLVWRSCSWL